jgi:hypothetical protein
MQEVESKATAGSTVHPLARAGCCTLLVSKLLRYSIQGARSHITCVFQFQLTLLQPLTSNFLMHHLTLAASIRYGAVKKNYDH